MSRTHQRWRGAFRLLSMAVALAALTACVSAPREEETPLKPADAANPAPQPEKPAAEVPHPPLENTQWQLEAWQQIDGEPAPAEGTPTLTLAEGRISGFAGCNRYFGPVTEPAPGEIRIAEIASTKMACPGPADAIESRFLGLLRAVDSYSFVSGRLLLSASGDSGSGTLVFREVAPAESR